MRVSANPFDEYWIFCTMNDHLSLIVKDNPSYVDFACMNSYSYYTRGYSWWWRDISIFWNDEYFSRFRSYIDYKEIETTKAELKAALITRLKNNIPIYLTLDAFYAFSNRFDYKKSHRIHDFLLTGYDEDSDNLIFFTDSFEGYGENYLSYENLVKAMIWNNEKVVFKEVTVSRDIPEYVMDKDEVKTNANNLMVTLGKLSFQNIWNVDRNRDFTDISNEIYTISKIAERQRANKALFHRMKDKGWISEQLEKEASEDATKVYNLWQSVKALWMKMSYRYNEKYLNSLNWCTKDAIVKEALMWNKIYNAL